MSADQVMFLQFPW